MKLGILGTGMIAQEFLGFKDKLPLEKVAILGTERSREKVEKLADTYKIDEVFYDYDDMLKNGDIDTVWVALPNHLHYSFARKAIEAGKNVILEKPATPTARELEELIDLADQKGVHVVEAMTVHSLPAFKALKEAIQDLGDMKIASMNYSQYSSRYDDFKKGIIQPAFDPAKNGGALMDINVYNIHAALGLFGKPEKVTYFANVENGIDTSGMMVLDYGKFKVQCIGAKDCTAPILSTLQGDNGSILIDHPFNEVHGYESIGFVADGGRKRPDTPVEHEYSVEHRMIPEFIEFIDWFDNNKVDGIKKHQEVSKMAAQVLEEGIRQRDQGMKSSNSK